MDILQREILDTSQECFIMIASVNEPYVYLRAKGKILHRWLQGDNIGYYIHIQEILEEFEIIRDFLHRSKQRVFSLSTDRGQIKTIDCFDLSLDMNTFNERFKERYKDFSWYLPAVFVFTNREDLESALTQSNALLKDKLENSLRLLQSREDRKQ